MIKAWEGRQALKDFSKRNALIFSATPEKTSEGLTHPSAIPQIKERNPGVQGGEVGER